MKPRLSLLGTPLFERDGRPVAFDTREAVALLAYLAVTARPHRFDSLATLLSLDAGRDAVAALDGTVSDIRRAAGGDVMRDDGGTLALDPAAIDVDVRRVRELLADVRRHDHPSTTVCEDCAAPLAEAAALHRGAFLEGYALCERPRFRWWQACTAEEVQRGLADVVSRLVDAQVLTGDLDQATRAAVRRLELEPLHEPMHRTLMRLYAWQGRREAALEQYRTCVRVLRSQLGVDPLEDTLVLSEAVLTRRVVPRPRGRGSRAGGSQHDPPAADPPRRPGSVVGDAVRRPPLVARDRELAMLSTTIERVHADGVVVVIEGEAGSGRTRLLEELMTRPVVADRRVLSTACHLDEMGRAYGVVTDLLRSAIGPTPATCAWLDELRTDVVREVGRVLPEVAELAGPPLPVDGQGATDRLTVALATALAAAASDGPQPPGILVIDDIQWSDQSSLDVLSHLTRRLPGRPMCVLLAWPTELVDRGHQLRRLVAHLARMQLVRQLPLGRLDAVAIRTLVGDTLGGERSDAGAVAEQILDATEGVPLLVVEYLAVLARDPRMSHDPPPGAEDLLRTHLGAVGPAARQVLTAAAVVGRPFHADLIRAVSGRTRDETAQALAELTATGLLAEPSRGRNRYDITHPRLRTVVYQQATPVRRRLLHGRAAAALERGVRHRDDPSLVAAIAAHHAAAGDAGAAATWFAVAATRAAKLLAVPEAVAHYEQALAHGHPDPAGIHEALGDLDMLVGRYRAALRRFDAAAALVDDQRRAMLEHRIAGVYQRWGRWTLADEHLCNALVALEGCTDCGAVALRARILTDRGLVAHRQGKADEARSLAGSALLAASEVGDPAAQAGAHNLLGVLSKADLPVARSHLEHALELARRHRDVGIEIGAANNLAQAHAAGGALDQALPLAEAALARAGQLADRHREAALRTNLADLLRAAGRHEEAMLHLKRAVALFAEIGEPDAHAPEIWSLAVW